MAFLVVLAVIVVLVGLLMRGLAAPGSRRIGGPGAGATGAVYDLLNEDKRKAIEIILEERAEYRDPEHADDVPPADDQAPPTGGRPGPGRT
jgi:hypothetical protein